MNNKAVKGHYRTFFKWIVTHENNFNLCDKYDIFKPCHRSKRHHIDNVEVKFYTRNSISFNWCDEIFVFTSAPNSTNVSIRTAV